MKVQQLVDVIALHFDKSNDFAFKQSLAIDVIAYRATLVKQQINKSLKVADLYLAHLKQIPIVEVGDCFYSEVDIPNWIPLENTSFFSVEIYDDKGCCINYQLDEMNITRLQFIKAKTFGNSLPFYILDNKKIKVYNINRNVKFASIRFVPSNYYEYAKLQNELTPSEPIQCLDIYDVEIEEIFRDGIEKFILDTYRGYKGTEDGDIHVAPDKT